ncbi:MAG: VOC family protein [Ilumatobacter sp.]|nr:VOC family protein [Ilumatobacter sp.]
MLIADIHHVSLNVTDTERALGFYRDLLGLGVLERPAFSFAGAWLDAGRGRQVHLIESPSVPDDVGQHVAFTVHDLDAAIDTIRAAGYDVSDAKHVADRDARQAFVLDPDGNRVELHQPAPDA